jgi:DNA-binding GntR family transcriptional regulator
VTENGNGPTEIIGTRRSRLPYELMMQAILEGEFQPGDVLVETTLAKKYNVSRTPIREALNRLEQDGVVHRSGRGLVVRERSPEEILDIYDVRIVLEAKVANEAALRRSKIDVILLKRLVREHTALEAPNEAMMAQTNRQFHRAVWLAAHHKPLLDLLTRLDLHLARWPATTLSQPGRWEEANVQHLELAEAIERQDADRAEALARDHFERARDLRLQIWAESHPV